VESVNKYKESIISELQKIKDRAFAQKKYIQLNNATLEKALAEKLREVHALFRFGLFFKPQNIDSNQELNINPNQELNINPNQELNIDPNQALNVEPDQELNIDPDQRIDLNQAIDINRYRFGLFSKPTNINPNQELDIDLNQKLNLETKAKN
ncbi:TPA: hypothetical protein F8R83_14580, partial [Legionella pneumophila]|nr:hypothetical protein [Legionella pneumophila]